MNYDMQPIVNVMDDAITKLNKVMKKSQKQQIRSYLEAGGKLTSKASRNFWDCERLASRIHEIRRDYINEWYRLPLNDETPKKEIDAPLVKTETGAWVAQYSLKNLA